MKIRIHPGTVNGTVTAPASKSVSHRAILCAALAQGTSVINNILAAEDIKQTIRAVRNLGVKVKTSNSRLVIHGVNGQIKPKTRLINVGASGTTMRLVTATAALSHKHPITITGNQRMQQRPMGELVQALSDLGIKIKTQNNGFPPVVIQGGKLTGKSIVISGEISSQFISGLLLIGPFFSQGFTIKIKDQLVSKPYVSLTLDVMSEFGIRVKPNKDFSSFHIPSGQHYRSRHYDIEGDYSSASYLLTASAITRAQVTVKNLRRKSKQGDKQLLQILKKIGCQVLTKENEVTVKSEKPLQSFKVKAGDIPDLVPTLIVLAANAQGKSEISNIAHLKFKESNRIEVPVLEFRKMGLDIQLTGSGLKIKGSKLRGASVNSHNDHRIAMSLSIAALTANGPTTIEGAESTTKSYPGFFTDLKTLGAKVEELP